MQASTLLNLAPVEQVSGVIPLHGLRPGTAVVRQGSSPYRRAFPFSLTHSPFSLQIWCAQRLGPRRNGGCLGCTGTNTFACLTGLLFASWLDGQTAFFANDRNLTLANIARLGTADAFTRLAGLWARGVVQDPFYFDTAGDRVGFAFGALSSQSGAGSLAPLAAGLPATFSTPPVRPQGEPGDPVCAAADAPPWPALLPPAPPFPPVSGRTTIPPWPAFGSWLSASAGKVPPGGSAGLVQPTTAETTNIASKDALRIPANWGDIEGRGAHKIT